MTKIHAIVMKAADNVCTVVETVEPFTDVCTEVEGKTITISVKEKIPFGHKFAIKTIEKGFPVVKYGETIGVATNDIQSGQHVHVHNIESCRGRGDK